MKLILNAVEVAGFGPFVRKQTVRFGGRGPVAVVGDNGVGKTTIVSTALVWCLYGKGPPQRMGSATKALSGRNVVNDDSKEAKVTCRFGIEGDTVNSYEVRRSRKPSGSEKVLVLHSTPGGPETIGTDQLAVDLLIGADYEVFTRTVVRGQGDPWNFAEATDGKKREILDAVSGSEALAPAYEAARSADSMQKGAIAGLEGRLVDAVRRVGGLSASEPRDRAKQWDEGREPTLTAAAADVAGYDQAIAEAEAAEVAMEAWLAARSALGVPPSLDMKPYDQAIAAVSAPAREAEFELRKAVADFDAVKDFKVGDTCSRGHQPIRAGASIVEVRKAAKVVRKRAATAEAETRSALGVHEDARDRASAWLRNAAAHHQSQIMGLGPEPSSTSAASSLKLAKAASQQRLADLRAATNPWIAAAEQAESQKLGLAREVAALEEGIRQAKLKKIQSEALVEALSPKGARASLGVAALHAVEAAANRWLAVLSAGRFTVQFTDGKQIRTVVTDRKCNKERDLLQLSGGQRTRVNFAVDLGVAAAFARGGSLALSLLVLDEAVFSNLDQPGKAAMVTAVHHAGVRDVVVIDHDPAISAALPRTLAVSIGTSGHSEVQELT